MGSQYKCIEIFYILFAAVGIFPHFFRVAIDQPAKFEAHGRQRLYRILSVLLYIWSAALISCLLVYSSILTYFFSKSYEADDKMSEILLKGFMGQWTAIAWLTAVSFAVKSRKLPKVIGDLELNLTSVRSEMRNFVFFKRENYYTILVIVATVLFVALSGVWVCLIASPMEVHTILEGIRVIIISIPTNLTLPNNPTANDYDEYVRKLANQSIGDTSYTVTLQNVLVDGDILGNITKPSTTAALLGVQILFMLITLPLHAGLKAVNKQLENIFDDTKVYDGKMFSSLESVFSRHLNLTLRICELDDIFGPALLWLFVSDMYVIVTGLGLLKGNNQYASGMFSDEFTAEKFGRSICLGIALLFLRMFCAIRVREQADAFGVKSAVLMERHRIFDRCSHTDAACFQTVHNRLAAVKGTFTLFQLCQLNKEFAATVIGAMLTNGSLSSNADLFF
ncbi:uncharacterized protein LOC129595410 [Paramacrobiotus metropolitanus]|uniref:uncharacterized protein LOC129595410 n=1 Tax=Paramacrobiotus metropolitanus TaxID=2943436 RepID=UPI002445DB1D|nr:uncharacterized protein LOC129595410 [Paramacrobiotus metropolitanus]